MAAERTSSPRSRSQRGVSKRKIGQQKLRRLNRLIYAMRYRATEQDWGFPNKLEAVAAYQAEFRGLVSDVPSPQDYHELTLNRHKLRAVIDDYIPGYYLFQKGPKRRFDQYLTVTELRTAAVALAVHTLNRQGVRFTEEIFSSLNRHLPRGPSEEELVQRRARVMQAPQDEDDSTRERKKSILERLVLGEYLSLDRTKDCYRPRARLYLWETTYLALLTRDYLLEEHGAWRGSPRMARIAFAGSESEAATELELVESELRRFLLEFLGDVLPGDLLAELRKQPPPLRARHRLAVDEPGPGEIRYPTSS